MKAVTAWRARARRMDRLIGPGAAILLGAASGFFCLAMPGAVIARLADPALVGGRLPLALLLGLAVGLVTWIGFAALDRAAVRPRRPAIAAPTARAVSAPVLRRADAHPDAPARRPIFAGADLGTPLDLIEPLPAVVAPAGADAGDTVPAGDQDIAETAPPAPPAPVAAEAPLAMPAPPEAIEPPSPPTLPALRSVPPPVAPPAQPPESLPALMTRLEAGLARRALMLAGAETNVTTLRREIRPIGGPLVEVVEELHRKAAGRR